MEVAELHRDDAASATALWTESGLTRPWNDPSADFERALQGATSAVLGLKHNNVLIGTVMVGNDGHRGWMYYLAVDKAHQHSGIATQLVRAAEEWLLERGAVKVQLMVRNDNESAMNFYDHIDYEKNDVTVLSRRLVP